MQLLRAGNEPSGLCRRTLGAVEIAIPRTENWVGRKEWAAAEGGCEGKRIRSENARLIITLTNSIVVVVFNTA